MEDIEHGIQIPRHEQQGEREDTPEAGHEGRKGLLMAQTSGSFKALYDGVKKTTPKPTKKAR